MEIEIKDVKNLKHHRDGSIIMEVLFSHLGTYVPFLATKDDDAEHGQMLYKYALEGKYGSIANADIPEAQHRMNDAKNEYRKELSLMETDLNVLRDAVELNIATAEETKRFNELRVRRVELSRLIK